MVEFIIGAAVGAGAMIAKDAMSNSSGNNASGSKQANRQETEELYAENEKLRNRNRDAERRNDQRVDRARAEAADGIGAHVLRHEAQRQRRDHRADKGNDYRQRDPYIQNYQFFIPCFKLVHKKNYTTCCLFFKDTDGLLVYN